MKFNKTQKIFLLIFLFSIILWIPLSMGYPLPDMVAKLKAAGFTSSQISSQARYEAFGFAAWYEIVLFATWLVSLFSIYLYKD